jgi:pectin methylesterase-like acyl-CoA thioesterase
MKTSLSNFFLRSLGAFLLCLSFSSAGAYDLIVAKDGTGQYTTVQAAIDAAPTNRTTPFRIFIKNGTYKEKITIPSNKPFIQITGESVAKTILTYDDYASKMLTCGTTVGTLNSGSFTINATDFSATNITFENSFGDGSQAVAVVVNNDRAVFKNCRFLGNQDTVYVRGSGAPRGYFKNCYIDGNVDFIFGNSIALFDSCVLYAKTRPATATSFITAANTPNGQAYGFVFRDARLPNNNGTTSYFLGRPWPSPSVADTRQKTVFLSSRMSSHINPAGWTVWDGNTQTANVYYGEYNSRYFNGAPVDVSQRVSWSYQLSQADSATYTFANMFGTWNPCAVQTGICDPIPTDIAVSNFRGVKGSSTTSFNWNISWPLPGITYNLYRSTDNINYTSIYSVTEPTDTAVNFSYSDPTIPPSGSVYRYYVAASKPGYATHNTDTIQISSGPTLVVNASAALSLCGFTQTVGSPSPSQTYTISGSDLTSNVTITPPPAYEVSTNQTTWSTNGAPLVLTPSGGTLTTTTIYVRLNAASTGNYAGNVVNASTGANTVNVPVSGNTVPQSTSFALVYWPLTQNSNDSASARASGITAGPGTLNRLVLSDNTQPSASPRPAYSGQYGQAFAATSTGSWASPAGPGGTLNRTYYQQFTITAAAGNSFRIDSLTFNAAFYQTANGRMSMVYSRNGFGSPADSTEYSGGNLGNTALTTTASGNFSRSFSVLQRDAGPSATLDAYALALNGNTGVTLTAGQTLTFRLYFAAGTTGATRFAYLKNVIVKGVNTSVMPLQLLTFNASNASGGVQLSWKTAQEISTSHFEIERSNDGRSFASVGSVNATSNLNGSSYSHVDPFLLSGKTYYRLKMYDRDGSFTFSKIIALTANRQLVSIYPNPATQLITVSHSTARPGSFISIVDATGKIVLQSTVEPQALQTTLDVQRLSQGVYLLKLSNGAEVTSSQFIKK